MRNPAYSIRFRSSARTNKGQVRQNNEDHVHLWMQEHAVLAIVADGMGGAVAGEEASRIAIETVREQIRLDGHTGPETYDKMYSEALAEKLREVVRVANKRILDRTVDNPEFKGMGTTLTLAFARHGDVLLAHVGDSRAYLVHGHNGEITQLTADHSFVQALVDAGHITSQEADEHPMKNVLYRALGQASEIEVDIHQDLTLDVGDRLVLCSDGLTLHVRPDEIAKIAMEAPDPDTASQKLVDLANERGGRDNISVIVIEALRDTSKTEEQSAVSSQMLPTTEDEEYETSDDTVVFVDMEEDTQIISENDSNGGSTSELTRQRTGPDGNDLTEPNQ